MTSIHWLTRALPLWNLLREPKELELVEGAGHSRPWKHASPRSFGSWTVILGPVR